MTDVDLATDRIEAAITGLRRTCGLPVEPRRRGPVPLDRFFEETGLVHLALPNLTRQSVGDFLRREGILVDDLGEPTQGLAGFLFVSGRAGWAFVADNDPLPRRRFSAAHELGHFLLHQGAMGRFRADTDETIQEANEEASDQMERQANRFAAELLMPAEVCRARAQELRKQHGCCPRGVLAYRLASELLVSRRAMTYRLQALGVGDD